LICDGCLREVAPDVNRARRAWLEAGTVDHVWHGVGCSASRGTSYHGWTGIYELLMPSAALREIALHEGGARRLHEQAVADGISTLREDGVRQVLAGRTTAPEVLRVTRA
jgi:type II secretory ATPase GspE/PulE/Tfp pilus assembly ATPase PilB-like protein